MAGKDELRNFWQSPLKKLSIEEIENLLSKVFTEATGSREPLEVCITAISFEKRAGFLEECEMQIKIGRKIEFKFDASE